MRSDDITRSAARLQHGVDTYCAHLDADHVTLFNLVRELRLALMEHADVVTELVRNARAILGDAEEIRCLLPMIDALFHLTDEIHHEVGQLGAIPALPLTNALVVIWDELTSAERHLMCRCGTILFPAETW